MCMNALHEAFNFLKTGVFANSCRDWTGLQCCSSMQKKYDQTTHFIQTRKCEMDGSWMGGAEYDTGRLQQS